MVHEFCKGHQPTACTGALRNPGSDPDGPRPLILHAQRCAHAHAHAFACKCSHLIFAHVHIQHFFSWTLLLMLWATTSRCLWPGEELTPDSTNWPLTTQSGTGVKPLTCSSRSVETPPTKHWLAWRSCRTFQKLATAASMS